MLEKLARGFIALRDEVAAVRSAVDILGQRPAPVNGADGSDGVDGVSPDQDAIVAEVLSKISHPEKIDESAIAADVLAKVPLPRDGRDAPIVSVSDVAAVVLAKIPAPEAAERGNDGATGPQGKQGPQGKKGDAGSRGASVTSVELKNNELFVFIDGLRKKAGKIKLPVVSAPFDPGGGGGRSDESSAPAAVQSIYGGMAITQRDAGDPDPHTISAVAHPSGDDTMNPPASPVAVGPGPFGGYYFVDGMIPREPISGVVVAGGKIEILTPGDYVLPGGWATFRHSSNGATTTFALAIERGSQLIFSQTPIANSQANNNKPSTTSGSGIFSVLAGDKISVWVATDTTGTVTIGNAEIPLQKL